jgi:hypothetical protein
MSSELNWAINVININYTIDNLQYGNGTYVARQQSSPSTILYSLDNIIWQVAFTSNILINKIVFLNNLFIAFGQPINYTSSMADATPSNLIITSPNGIDWTYRSSPAIFRLLAAAYGNNTFVIVGTTNKGTNNANYSLTSTDGFTWTLRYGSADNPWSGVAFGNGKFIAITDSGTWGLGERYKLMISTDGITWYLRPISSAYMKNRWHSIIYANNRFVAIGDQISPLSNGIMFSEDGSSWYSSNDVFMSNQNLWSSVVYDGYYVYITGRGYNFRSRITNNTPVWTDITKYPIHLSTTFSTIQYLNGQLFIMGANNYLVALSTTENSGLVTVTFSGSGNLSQAIVNAGLGSATKVIIGGYSSIGGSAFNGKTQITSITIPDSVTVISDNAFRNCSGLTSITIPDSVTIINNQTFYLCSNLSSVTLGNSVTNIGSSAFEGCSELTLISLGNSVTSIGLSAFAGCVKLTSITIPDSVRDIRSYAFQGCTSLTTVVIRNPSTINTVYQDSFQDVVTTYGSSITFHNTESYSDLPAIWQAISTLFYFKVYKPTQVEPTVIFPAINVTYGDSSATISYTSNSTGAVTFTSSNTSVATISGSTITFVGAGTSSITATQAETINYLAASITCSLTVNTIIKTIPTISGFNITEKIFGTASFTLSPPTSNSSGTFTYSSENTDVATISGSTVTILKVGSTLITATQAGTFNYLSGSTSVTLNVIKQTPILTGFTNITKTFGDSSFNLPSLTSSSPSVITYSSSNTEVATIFGNSVTIIGVGLTIITATQASTPNYELGTTSLNLTVSKANPIITGFTNITKTFGDSSFDLSAPTSNSDGLFTYSSSDTSVATISGSTLTIIGASSNPIVITATQASTPNYELGTTSLNLTVNQATPILSNFNNLNKTFGDSSFDLSAPTSNSDGLFTYSTLNTEIATIYGNEVTVVKVGTAIITATQAATTNYTAASITLTLTIIKGTPTFSGFTNIIKNFGDTKFTLIAPTSNSTGLFMYSSSDETVATISGSIVTIVKAGETIIKATQGATDYYLEGEKSLTLNVNKITPILSNFTNLIKTFGETFILTDPISTSPGEFIYSSSNNNIASIVGKTVTMVGTGEVQITSTQLSSTNYLSGIIICSLTVNKSNPIISNFTNITKTFGNVPFSLTDPISTSSGLFSFISLNNEVATISGNIITIVGAGIAKIKAIQSTTSNYNSSFIECELKVNRAIPILGNFNSKTKMIYDNDFLLDNPSSTSPGAFRYVSSNTNVASVSGNFVLIIGGGNTTIQAIQEETNNYESASITCSLTILKNITNLSNFNNLEKTFGDNDFILSHPTSNREGNYSYVSSNPQVAIVSNNVVKIVGGGLTTITAIQTESTEYSEGRINCVLTVFRINPKLININNTYENNEYQISYESTSDGTYSYSFSDNSAVKINPNNTLTFLKKATVIVTIHQEETANYFKGTFSTIIDHNE